MCGRDSNRTPPECKTIAMPLDQIPRFQCRYFRKFGLGEGALCLSSTSPLCCRTPHHLTCWSARRRGTPCPLPLRDRKLKYPYTMGFMQELVQANRKSPFWTLWSTAPADASSIQYLQQAVVGTYWHLRKLKARIRLRPLGGWFSTQ